MDRLEDVATPTAPPHRDRSVGLVLFGVLEVLIGIGCALLVPLVLVAAVAGTSFGEPGASPDLRSAIPSLVVYGSAAVAFVWIGIGSIRARRWAQKLMLVVSWLWVITGVFTMAMSVWIFPAMLSQLGAEAGLPGGTLIVVLAGVFAFVGFVFLVLPTAFVLFYRSPHVAATCRRRDPGPSRIADAPSHILSLILIYVLGAVSVLSMPAYNFAMPFFGVVLSGFFGAAAWAAVLVVLGYLAKATLERDPRAWWVSFVATAAAALATTVSMAVVPLDRLVMEMGLPPAQAALVHSMELPGPAGLALLSAVTWVSFFGYLWYAKRYFGPGDGFGG